MKTTLNTNNGLNISLMLVRLILGAVMAAHGAQKLFGWFGGFGFEGTMAFFTETMGFSYLLALLIILGESFGMLALMLGLFTRFFSAVVIAIMAGAIVFTHGEHGFFMNWFGSQNGEGIEYHLLASTLALVLLINGAGIYSIDFWLSRKFKTREARHKPSLT